MRTGKSIRRGRRGSRLPPDRREEGFANTA
jgi:hypothetical protein